MNVMIMIGLLYCLLFMLTSSAVVPQSKLTAGHQIFGKERRVDTQSHSSKHSLCRAIGYVCVKLGTICPEHFSLEAKAGHPYCDRSSRCCYSGQKLRHLENREDVDSRSEFQSGNKTEDFNLRQLYNGQHDGNNRQKLRHLNNREDVGSRSEFQSGNKTEESSLRQLYNGQHDGNNNGCVDHSSWCGSYAHRGYCQNYYSIRLICPKTCGTCVCTKITPEVCCETEGCFFLYASSQCFCVITKDTAESFKWMKAAGECSSRGTTIDPDHVWQLPHPADVLALRSALVQYCGECGPFWMNAKCPGPSSSCDMVWENTYTYGHHKVKINGNNPLISGFPTGRIGKDKCLAMNADYDSLKTPPPKPYFVQNFDTPIGPGHHILCEKVKK